MTKNPPPKPHKTSSDTSSKTVWLWAAAIAAWNVGVDPEGPRWAKWAGTTGQDERLEVARLLLHRHRGGPDVFKELAAQLSADGRSDPTSPHYTYVDDPTIPAPAGFVSWKRTADELFAELGLNADPTEYRPGQVVCWSPYHLVLVRDPKDPAYDERIEHPVKPEMVSGLIEYGRAGDRPANYELVKVVVRKKSLVVADGRQRSRGHIIANADSLGEWYDRVVEWLNGVPPLAGAFDPPRLLLRGVECIVRPLAELVLLKVLSNSGGTRTNETLLQEARCAWELADLGKSPQETAALRGATPQTVRNYLSLRKLTAEWLAAIRDGSVSIKTGYRLGRETTTRQEKGWKHIAAREKAATAAEKKARGWLPHDFEAQLLAQRDRAVNRWLDGGSDEAERPAGLPVRDRARTHDRLEGFRAHLQRLPASPIVDVVREIAAALLGDVGATKKLPPQLRVGLTGAWLPYTAEERDRWNAAGVWDPATLFAIDLYGGQNHIRLGLPEQPRITPQQACACWKDGLTLGGAVEAGHLTPAAFWAALRQEQLALPPATEVTGEKAARKRQAGRKDKVAMWGSFAADAWEQAGIFDAREAGKLEEVGITPERLQLVMPAGDGADMAGKMFGTLYTMGLVSLSWLRQALDDGVGEAAEDVDQADAELAVDRGVIELADAAYSVECPSCEAAEGQPCSGEDGTVAPHLVRKIKSEKHQGRRGAEEARA